MVKPFASLASRVVRAHQELAPCFIRIQSGFMTERNIETAEKTLHEMQEMLRDMRTALRAPKSQFKDDTFIPLK